MIAKLRVMNNVADVFYQNVLAMTIVLVFYANIPLYLNKITDTYIAGSLNLLLLWLIAPFVLLRFRDAIGFLSTELAWWGIFVTAMYGINVFRATQGDFVFLEDEWIDEINRFQRQALMLGIMVVVYLSDPKIFSRFILIVAPVIPVTIILSFFAPELLGLRIEDSGRASGMYLNPNLASEALLTTVLLSHLRISKFWLLLYFLLSGLAVILTFSRSGIAAWLLLGTYLMYRRQISRKFILVPIFVALSYSTLLLKAEGVLLDAMDGNQSNVSNMINRLAFFAEIGTSRAIEDSSSESRVDVAVSTFHIVTQQPIVGHVLGPRAEFGIEAHNLPLEYWYTFGIMGLIAWLWMCWILFKSGVRSGLHIANPYLMIFLWLSMFNHQQFTQIFWWVFFAIIATSKLDIAARKKRPVSDAAGKVKKRRKRRRSSRSAQGGKVSQSW